MLDLKRHGKKHPLCGMIKKAARVWHNICQGMEQYLARYGIKPVRVWNKNWQGMKQKLTA